MRFRFTNTILASLSLLRTNIYRSTSRITTIPTQSIQRIQVLRASMPIPFIGSLFSSSAPRKMKDYPVQKSEQEWQAVLSPEQFRIIREKGTEAPYSGQYDKAKHAEDDIRTYNCAACNAPLYIAKQKFDSGCGWPAFFDTVPGAVERHEDRSGFMTRTEIVCAKCGGHLGHVFKGEGLKTERGRQVEERHCVNSVSVNFADGDKIISKGDRSKV